MRIPLFHILLITMLSCGLMSCASMSGHSPSEAASLSQPEKSKSIYGMSLSPLTNLFIRERPKIVTVRKEDLQCLPTGHQLAKSYQRRSRYEIKGGPIDFQEPTMPNTDSPLNGSLLPPR